MTARFLDLNLKWAERLLARALARAAGDAVAGTEADLAAAVAELERLGEEMPELPYFALCRRGDLLPLECQVLALCLARHIEPRLGDRLRHLPARGESSWPTPADFALLTATDPPSVRIQALALSSPRARLRALRLLERPDPTADGLLGMPLSLTAPCLALLLGEPIDSPYYRLRRFDDPDPAGGFVAAAGPQRDAMLRAVTALAAAFQRDDRRITRERLGLLVLLFGPHGVGKSTLARDVAAAAFHAIVEVDGAAAARSTDVTRLLHELFDAAVVHSSAVLIRNSGALTSDAATARLLVECVRRCRTCVFVTQEARDASPALDAEWDYVGQLQAQDIEPARLWQAHLAAAGDDVDLASLGERYALPGLAVARAARLALAASSFDGDGRPAMADLERAAQQQLDASLGAFVTTVHPRHGLDDLVLPAEEHTQIGEIIDAYNSWHHVMGRWGLGERLSSGKCISALFSGEPGTGKTFAAEVIARTISEPLQVVSLPNILSKWYGETERQIHDLFGRARSANAVLLLDEADALFASRVEVRSAQDNSMNMMTGMLLQELDRHTGLVIMTTNLAENIDRAFQRRIMFHIRFPKPDPAGRQEIWLRLIPPQMPLGEDVDLEALSRDFELSGGEIKNAVMRASFRAWAEGTALTHDLLRVACEQEYRHTGRLLFQAEAE